MSHTKGLAEVKELPCSKGGTMKFLLVSGTGIAVMCGKVGGAKVEEGNARRLAALWNMADRLGLTTEEIESGNVETKLNAAPDMLEALEEVMDELDVEGLPCPLCGRNLTIGHRHNCLWHVVESAVRKARGEE